MRSGDKSTDRDASLSSLWVLLNSLYDMRLLDSCRCLPASSLISASMTCPLSLLACSLERSRLCSLLPCLLLRSRECSLLLRSLLLLFRECSMLLLCLMGRCLLVRSRECSLLLRSLLLLFRECSMLLLCLLGRCLLVRSRECSLLRSLLLPRECSLSDAREACTLALKSPPPKNIALISCPISCCKTRLPTIRLACISSSRSGSARRGGMAEGGRGKGGAGKGRELDQRWMPTAHATHAC